MLRAVFTVNKSKTTHDQRSSMHTVDGVLRRVGEFGTFQRQQFVLLSWQWVPIAFQLLAFVFILPARVDWACPSCNATATDPCDEDADRVFAEPARTITATFDLVCERAQLIPLPSCAIFAGMLMGSGVFGVLADRLGRKPIYHLTLLGSFACAVLSAGVTSFAQYIVVRVCAGFFLGGVQTVIFVLMTEFVGPGWRGFIGTFTMAFFTLGEVGLAALAALAPSWRVLLLLACLAFLPSFGLWPRVHESPRWLLQQARSAEAEHLLEIVAKTNRASFAGMSLAPSPPQRDEPCLPSGLFSPRLARYTFVLMTQFAVCDFLFYGVSLAGTTLSDNPYVNFVLSALAELPAYVIAYWAMERPSLGRRLTLLASYILAAAACALIPAFSHAPPALLVAAAMVGKMGVVIAFDIIYIYAVEIFPTPVRSGGLGLCILASRIGSVLSPFIGTSLSGIAGFALFAILAAVCALSTLTLPETRGLELPDSLDDVRTDSIPLAEAGLEERAALVADSSETSL
eukprot:m.129228 g.129228  ORF g.129228 m.129228 type:complete len:514 (-) comp9427_c0_seq1:227-1768(-)